MTTRLEPAMTARQEIRDAGMPARREHDMSAETESMTAAVTVANMLRRRGVQADPVRLARLATEARTRTGRTGPPVTPQRSEVMTRSDARFAAGLLRNCGITADPERILDRAEADRERAKVDGQAVVQRVQEAVWAVRSANKSADLELWDMKRHPCAESRARAAEALAARTAAVEHLRELCCGDQALMAAVLARP